MNASLSNETAKILVDYHLEFGNINAIEAWSDAIDLDYVMSKNVYQRDLNRLIIIENLWILFHP